jgi:hypothetical protein
MVGYRLLYVFYLVQQPPPPPVGQDFHIYEVSRSHTTTRHARVVLLWTSDQLVAETST